MSLLVIDEAYHLLRGKNYTAVMDTLKTLVDGSPTKILMIGSYDLFDLVSDYGQVARRSEILHLERYQKEIAEDLVEFESIINKLQANWPCEQVPNFIAIVPELLEASLGCIGLVKALMLKSLSFQLKNRGKWKTEFLKKSAKSNKLFEKIRKDIVDGEEKIKGATYGDSLFSGKILDSINEKMNEPV